jgi:GDPmannose 4,6-dehydratase
MKLRWEGEGVDELGILESVDKQKYNLATGLEFGTDSTFNLQPSTPNTPIVRIDPRYFRPTEVDLLLGDPTKANTKLGWKPKYDLPMLVKEMMESDLQLFQRDLDFKKAGHVVVRQEE